jgi:hypothetical protein
MWKAVVVACLVLLLRHFLGGNKQSYDLRKMGVKNWKQRAQERKQWKELIEQAKTHKEL